MVAMFVSLKGDPCLRRSRSLWSCYVLNKRFFPSFSVSAKFRELCSIRKLLWPLCVLCLGRLIVRSLSRRLRVLVLDRRVYSQKGVWDLLEVLSYGGFLTYRG